VLHQAPPLSYQGSLPAEGRLLLAAKHTDYRDDYVGDGESFAQAGLVIALIGGIDRGGRSGRTLRATLGTKLMMIPYHLNKALRVGYNPYTCDLIGKSLIVAL